MLLSGPATTAFISLEDIVKMYVSNEEAYNLSPTFLVFQYCKSFKILCIGLKFFLNTCFFSTLKLENHFLRIVICLESFLCFGNTYLFSSMYISSIICNFHI